MINISEANKAKWNTSADHKVLTITFPDDNVTITNNDIVSESLNLEESINEDNVLTFTGCIASRFSFEVADIIQDLRGHRLTASISIGGEAAIPIFYGYVDTQDNLSHQDVVTKFEAYDPLVSRINEVDVTSWYNGLSFPRTVRNFRDAFFTYLGISQRTVSLPNDGLQMTGKTIDDEAITGGQIVKYICQLNGVFGQFDRQGYFTYRKLTPITKALYPAVDLYPSPDLFPSRENSNADASSIYSAIRYEPFEVDKISKVNIVDSSGAIQGTYGSGSNAYTIADNPLAWAVNMTSAAQNIYNAISQIWFVPSEIGAVGLPYIECGDILFINTMKNIVRSYVLSRSLTGIQAIADAYRCPSDKRQPIYKESVETQIQRNADGIVETQEMAVELVEEEATRANNLIAREIQAEVVRTNNLVASEIQAEVTRTNTLVATSIQAEATRTNTLVANSISASETRTDSLIASSISASETRTDNLIAQKADISSLNATNATVSQLNSEIVATNTVLATKASITDLNAVTARVGTLEANSITTSYLSSNTVVVGGILCYGNDGKGLICNSYITIGGKTWSGRVQTVQTTAGSNVTVPIID